MRLIDADNLRGRVCEIFLCAEPGSAEERRLALVLGLIDSEHTIAPPPNAPLTLDELREMEGEPVFLKRPGYCDRWALVKVSTETLNVYFILVDGIEDETFISAEIEIKNGCKVYRRKPEEGTP